MASASLKIKLFRFVKEGTRKVTISKLLTKLPDHRAETSKHVSATTISEM